ncbi:MAG TPA: hypothetical protein VK395_01675 [Gemmataceae bacterium]|nr:hypothetical protein [Gemmataceae bacterium]
MWFFAFLILLAISGSQYAAHERRLRLLERKIAFLLGRSGADTAAIEAAFQEAEEATRGKSRTILLVLAVSLACMGVVGALVLTWLLLSQPIGN